MRKFLRVLTLMLLVVGLLFLPASPAAAKKYQPGDHLSLSADFEATVTNHDRVYIPHIDIWGPSYVTVKGLAFVTDNETGLPVGVMQVDWVYGVISAAPDGGHAYVGPFVSQSTDFGFNSSQLVQSVAVIDSAIGQFKTLIGTSTMTLTLPVRNAPGPGDYTFTGVPAHIEFDLYF